MGEQCNTCITGRPSNQGINFFLHPMTRKLALFMLACLYAYTCYCTNKFITKAARKNAALPMDERHSLPLQLPFHAVCSQRRDQSMLAVTVGQCRTRALDDG